MNLHSRFHQSTLIDFSRIQEVYPSAIIAGGAVRDLALGRDIKDLDIFISGTPNESITVQHIKNPSHWIHKPQPYWRNILEDEKWVVNKMPGSMNIINDPAIDVIMNLFNPAYNNVFSDKIPHIDLIFLLKPALEYFKERFDFDICKAYFDGRKFSYTSSFMRDAKNQTITLSGPKKMDFIGYSLRWHYPRIKFKYPTYQKVIPLDYKQFINNSI